MRLTGKRDKATELFTGQEDSLWQYYLRDGQYEKARVILVKRYDENSENLTVVRGLSIIARNTEDKEALKMYSNEVLEIENSKENELMQIHAYLEVGLVKEAELKLASFRERYPDEAKGILLEAWSAMTMGGWVGKKLLHEVEKVLRTRTVHIYIINGQYNVCVIVVFS